MTPTSYVLQHWKKKTVNMMVRDSKFTINQIWAACRELDIEPINERDFKTAIILSNYEKHSAEEIAVIGAMSVMTVKAICDLWGITCLTPAQCKERNKNPTRSFWDTVRAAEEREWKRDLMKGDIDFSWVDE